MAEQNGGAPDDQGTAFCSAQAGVPPSGNPYHGEFSTEKAIHLDKVVNRSRGSRGTSGSRFFS